MRAADAAARAGLYVVACAALALAACGGDGEEPAPTDTSTATTSPSAVTTAEVSATSEAQCDFADAAEQAIAASVLVITPQGYGTAFHVGGGEFVTAEHVAGSNLTVRLESDIFQAEADVVAVEASADVALLRVDPVAVGDLASMRWFDGERVRAGVEVGTAGYPVDVTGAAAITRGAVSKVATSDNGITVVQTDAPVNPGNSGGALFDDCGAVVGVVVEKWAEAGVEGVAYATAFDTAQAALAKARPPEPTAVAAGLGDGTYTVGIDIQPGTYANSDSSGFCYWERLSGFTADQETGFGHVDADVIDSAASFELQTVEVLPTDAGFYALDCGEWTALELASPTPPADSGTTISVFDLQVGDCFELSDEEIISDVVVFDCAVPHTYELYAAFDAGTAADPFPGDAALEDLWLNGCRDRFGAFTGTAYEDSSLDFGAIYPSVDSWSEGDRLVTCYVYDLFGDMLTGSMAGQGR